MYLNYVSSDKSEKFTKVDGYFCMKNRKEITYATGINFIVARWTGRAVVTTP